jgi:hypothetical protein
VKGLDRGRFIVLAGLTCAVGAAGPVMGQVDSLTQVVSTSNAVSGTAIGAYGYDPAHDAIYVTSFGAGGSLRRVNNVFGLADPGAGQSVTENLVSMSQWQGFWRDGVGDRQAAQSIIIGGLLLNPQAIGGRPAYSFAVLTDTSTVVRGSATVDGHTNQMPELTRRVYSYNLGQVGAAGTPPPPYGDGRDVFTSLLTLGELNALAGQSASNATSNLGRQFAWSPDGQRVYFNDSSSQLGSIWRLDPVTGAAARIRVEAGVGVEPAVLAGPAGVDRILYQGTDATGNDESGIDYIDHDPVAGTTSAPSTLLAGSAVRDFIEAASIDLNAIAVGENGDLFFNANGGTPGATGPINRAILRLDAQGRLSKVVSHAERDLFFTGTIGTNPSPNANAAKLQPRQTTYAGPNGSYAITQVLYAEQSPVNLIAGAYAFKAGDFDRDNDVDAADAALFKPAISVRNLRATPANLVFDLNGNAVVDWKDVKVLQGFYAFEDGDVNIDQLVDFTDLDTVGANYLASGRTWTQGELTGDAGGLVDFADLSVLAGSWLGLGQTAPQLADLDAHGYTGQFRSDVIAAFQIPEPSSLAAIAVMAIALGRRRSR